MQITKFINFLKKIYIIHKYKALSIIVGKNCNLFSNIILEGKNKIGNNCKIGGKLGVGTYVGNNCYLIADIGRYSAIANDVKIIVGNHPTKTFVSIHPCFYSINSAHFSYIKKNKFKEIDRFSENCYVKIGNDVWIGEHVRILSGVTIGNGSIIAAGSIVTKDVPEYSIYGGVPAKLIRKRFSNDQINQLNKIKWWDKDEKWLIKNADLFDNIEDALIKWKEEN